jgi:methylenetetrahydrofolate reductase (NADPH)
LVEAPSQSRDLAAILHGYSIEVTSREPKTIASCADHLDPGTEVYLTWIRGDEPARSVAAAIALRRSGFNPVPHICARHLESHAQLAELIARFAGEAAVDQALVIAGDRDAPAGPYESSQQVLETGLLEKHGIRRVGVSGFPEGNPQISESDLAVALAAKRDYARRSGLQLQIVTQFCFESAPILAWLRRLRRVPVDLPVRIGLAGPANAKTLLRFAVRCGIGNSLRALTRGPSLARLLIHETSPEPIVADLADAMAAEPGLNIVGLHFFVFGGFEKTADWVAATRER